MWATRLSSRQSSLTAVPTAILPVPAEPALSSALLVGDHVQASGCAGKTVVSTFTHIKRRLVA